MSTIRQCADAQLPNGSRLSQGWDVAKPGLPERIAASLQSLLDFSPFDSPEQSTIGELPVHGSMMLRMSSPCALQSKRERGPSPLGRDMSTSGALCMSTLGLSSLT
jgi:hypothetical protein